MSYQQSHFRESAPPTVVNVESPEWRQAVMSALPNSTAALLYGDFAPTVLGIESSPRPPALHRQRCIGPRGPTSAPRRLKFPTDLRGARIALVARGDSREVELAALIKQGWLAPSDVETSVLPSASIKADLQEPVPLMPPCFQSHS